MAIPAAILAFAAARPGPLRREAVVWAPNNSLPGVTPLREQKRVVEEVRECTQAGMFVPTEYPELLFLLHQVNPLPVIYWNATTYSYYGDVPNEDRLEAAMRLLLSVEPDAFVWTLRAPMPRRLHEAFAFHSVGSGRNGYRIPLMVRRPARANP